MISIHALLAESDAVNIQRPAAENDFYPRSPCGERLARCRFWVLSNAISIHALLAESDLNVSPIPSDRNADFYPRSPCGERRRGAVPVILII